MKAILFYSPYVLVPLLITLLFRQIRWLHKGWTYLATAVLIFCYPYGLQRLDEYLNPPPPGPICGNPFFAFVLANLVILLPIALLMQFLFNRSLWKKHGNEATG